jgi:RNase P/RNase MRP subunit POP5
LVVKDDVGRVRYVAFRMEARPPLARAQLERLLPEGARLTRYDGVHGIVRTTHRSAAALLDHLRAQPVLITTIATSGTLRGAARRLPASTAAATRGPRRRTFK